MLSALTFAQKNWVQIKDTTKVENSIEIKEKPMNVIFVELAGNGMLLSLNYERFINNEYSIRIGYGTGVMVLVSYPVMLNYNLPNSPFEVGIGLVPFTHAELFGLDAGVSPKLLLTSSFGFKRINRNFMFKAEVTPFYNFQDRFIFFFGLSGGIAF